VVLQFTLSYKALSRTGNEMNPQKELDIFEQEYIMRQISISNNTTEKEITRFLGNEFIK